MSATGIIILICATLVCLGLLFVAGLAMLGCFLAVRTAFAYQSTIAEYSRFFEILIDTLESDTYFLKTELARTLADSKNIPQYKELNQGLQVFQNRIYQIKQALVEMGMMRE